MRKEKMETRLKSSYREESPQRLKELLEDKIYRVGPTMEYLRNLILDLKMFLRILSDAEFDLKEEARRDFTSTILAFVEKKRALPMVGYWDVYKLANYVKEKHREEINRYFSQVRHFIANYF